jgi:hypothetical protein
MDIPDVLVDDIHDDIADCCFQDHSQAFCCMAIGILNITADTSCMT